MAGRRNLRQGNHKMSGRRPPVCSSSAVRKRSRVRRLRRCSSSVSGFRRMPINGGKDPAAIPLATSKAAATAWPSFLRVGTVAVAIFEIDAKVLHRLAAKLCHRARVHIFNQRTRRSALGSASALRRAKRRLAHNPPATFAPASQPLRGGGLEEMRAAVHHVHRLPRARIPGISDLERGIGFV